MPRLAPEKRGSGAKAARPGPALPVPDQSRYGPRGVTITGDRKRVIAYTEEGDGWVATCKGCGWIAWTNNRRDTENRARDEHKKCKGTKDEDD